MNQLLQEEKNHEPRAPSLTGSILIGAALIAGAVLLKNNDGGNTPATQTRGTTGNTGAELATATKRESISLPIQWKDLGQKLVSVGILDREKFLALYDGTKRESARRLIDEREENPIEITEENADIWLNLLWGVGLGNKNKILEQGPMANPRFGGKERFASTGGWTISDSEPMSHYSMHPIAILTIEQEELVARVAKGIFRPCCDNPTHFPDCNHGMAMLGLLEIMASQGSSEKELYEAGLAINRLWFPTQYETIDRYITEHKNAPSDAKSLLSAEFASASGFKKIARALETAPAPRKEESGGCSV